MNLPSAGRVDLRRVIVNASGRRACWRCGFPLDATGCDDLSGDCGVADPSSRLAWLDGPSDHVIDRLAVEAVAAQHHLVPQLASELRSLAMRRGDVRITPDAEAARGVGISLEGPVALAADITSLLGLWNGTPSANRTFLADRLDYAVRHALAVVAPSGAADIDVVDHPDDDAGEVDVDDQLIVLATDPECAGPRTLLSYPWLGSYVALARPDLSRRLGDGVVAEWEKLRSHDIEDALEALSSMAAGAARLGRLSDAGALLVSGWTMFRQYQSSEATSDWCIVGDRFAPLILAWATFDAGAWALATLLASAAWEVVLSETSSKTLAIDVTCRRRVT